MGIGTFRWEPGPVGHGCHRAQRRGGGGDGLSPESVRLGVGSRARRRPAGSAHPALDATCSTVRVGVATGSYVDVQAPPMDQVCPQGRHLVTAQPHARQNWRSTGSGRSACTCSIFLRHTVTTAITPTAQRFPELDRPSGARRGVVRIPQVTNRILGFPPGTPAAGGMHRRSRAPGAIGPDRQVRKEEA